MHWLIRLLVLGIVAAGNWVSLTLMAVLVLIGWRGATGDSSSDLPMWLPVGTAVAMVCEPAWKNDPLIGGIGVQF